MLALVVKKEREDLEYARSALIDQQNSFKIRLKELEDNLLESLQNSGDNILENVDLIENLEKTKITAEEIKAQVVEAKQTEIMINAARESYRPVAIRGSLLYFQIEQLKLIQTLYQFSLNAFVVVFNRAIMNTPQPELDEKERTAFSQQRQRQSPQNKNSKEIEPDVDPSGTDAIDGALREKLLKKRIALLIETITYSLFLYVDRGLFEKHKLIFVTNLCLKIMEDMLDPEELAFLIMGSQASSAPEVCFNHHRLYMPTILELLTTLLHFHLLSNISPHLRRIGCPVNRGRFSGH